VAEKERQIGRYVIKEHTARRLVAEASGRPLVALGILWGVFLPVAILIEPWRGGTRLLITVTATAVAAAVSLLIVSLVPQQERLTVDVEAGEGRAERVYLLPRKAWEVRVVLTTVEGVRCRQRLWRDAPNVEATRWVVELVGKEGETWRLAEGAEESPMRRLARLVAEVAGRPLVGAEG
jgi:hypothetical protein